MAPKRARTDKTATNDKTSTKALADKPSKELKPSEAKTLLAAGGSTEYIAESAFASRYLSEPVPKDT